MISLLLEIQELRLVVKAQLDGTAMGAPLSPRPPHRVTLYDVCVMMGPLCMSAYTRVGWYMPLSNTVGLSRVRNHGLLGRPLSYADPNRGSVGKTLDHASVMIHPMDMA